MEIKQLTRMSPEDRARAVNELGRKGYAPRNGQAKGIDERILAYETRFSMTSAEMRRRFASGELADTEETARWLLLLRARDR